MRWVFAVVLLVLAVFLLIWLISPPILR